MSTFPSLIFAKCGHGKKSKRLCLAQKCRERFEGSQANEVSAVGFSLTLNLGSVKETLEKRF